MNKRPQTIQIYQYPYYGKWDQIIEDHSNVRLSQKIFSDSLVDSPSTLHQIFVMLLQIEIVNLPHAHAHHITFGYDLKRS